MGTVITNRNRVPESRVAKRLPRPADPAHVRSELDQKELREIEDAAHACRLSVAGFFRVAVLEVARACNADSGERRIAALMKLADEIVKDADATNRPKPGRPKKE